jgi:hypothetical protein
MIPPRPDNPKFWKWIISVHESGHLCIAHLLGHAVDEAVVLPGEKGGITKTPLAGIPFTDARHARICSLVTAAGPIATEMICGPKALDPWRWRMNDARDFNLLYTRSEKFGAVPRRWLVEVVNRTAVLVALHMGIIEETAERIYRFGWAGPHHIRLTPNPALADLADPGNDAINEPTGGDRGRLRYVRDAGASAVGAGVS